MTILTPENAAFSPSGSGGSLPLAAQYELVETVNADFGPTADAWFVPTDGLYIWGLFIQTISPAGAGTLTVNFKQGAAISTGSSIDVSLTGLPNGYGGLFYTPFVLAVDGQATIERTLAGLAAGPVTYRITASAYKLC